MEYDYTKKDMLIFTNWELMVLEYGIKQLLENELVDKVEGEKIHSKIRKHRNRE